MADDKDNAQGDAEPPVANTDDVTSDWIDDQSAQLRDAGYKIVRFGDQGIVYVGQVDYDDKPDGTGFMFLPSGDLHQCQFRNGRANGEGMYITKAGTEIKGEWRMNLRVGKFRIVDINGVHWMERYNDEGKKVARKKVREEKPNPNYTEGGEEPATIKVQAPCDESAKKCWYCDNYGRERNNHSWACRAHPGRFTEDLTYRGDGPRPGVWSCCGRETRAEPGCAFRPHYFMDSEE